MMYIIIIYKMVRRMEDATEVYVSARQPRMGMNRAERRLYNMELRVLRSRRWSRMCEKMGWTKPTQPREVRINGRLRRTNACAGEVMEFSKRYYRSSDAKGLRRTVTHELIHYAMRDNGVADRGWHGARFEEAAVLMGITRGYAQQWVCNCGWWLKTARPVYSVFCPHCAKTLVRAGEYKKLERIARIGSKVRPVNIEAYAVARQVRSL